MIKIKHQMRLKKVFGFPQQRHLSSLALSLQVKTSQKQVLRKFFVFDMKNLSKFPRTFQHFPDTPNEKTGTMKSFTLWTEQHFILRNWITSNLLLLSFSFIPRCDKDQTQLTCIDANSCNFFPGFAWVTLATNDSYSLGALVVANSLRRVGTQHQLAVLITPGVTEPMRSRLQESFDLVQLVNVLDSKDAANLAVLKRPELGITFTKLHCWNLTQFEKCVFLDADVLVS